MADSQLKRTGCFCEWTKRMTTPAKICVHECMTPNVVTVTEDTHLADAIRLMENRCLAALPVVDADGCLRGVLSSSDLVSFTRELQGNVSIFPLVSASARGTLANALAADNETMTVYDAMNTEIATISQQATLRDAARRLLENVCHHLPVIDESRKPIGIISTTDIVRVLAEQSRD
ncbi:CBS domain-containing protein [Saprospiraceae bacterium]|nr:CBS domain-containing protein [Saprospiraceae bacterium]